MNPEAEAASLLFGLVVSSYLLALTTGVFVGVVRRAAGA